MKEELQRLLDRWNYDASLAWFKKHVEGKFFLKNVLSKGSDAYNTQKLKEELFDILRSLPEEEVIVTANKKETATLPSSARSDASDRPSDGSQSASKNEKPKLVSNAAQSPEELHLNEEWKPLYKEAAYYHSQLHESKSEAENFELAIQILDTMDEVEKIWKERDFVRQYGVKPDFEFQGLESLSPSKMLTRRNTLRSYVSKAKKGKLNAEKIPEWEAEISNLEKLMQP